MERQSQQPEDEQNDDNRPKQPCHRLGMTPAVAIGRCRRARSVRTRARLCNRGVARRRRARRRPRVPCEECNQDRNDHDECDTDRGAAAAAIVFDNNWIAHGEVFPARSQAQTVSATNRTSVGWSVLGAVIAGILAGLAFVRSRAPGGFYDADVYGMTPVVHRRYVWTALAFFAAFLCSAWSRADTIGIWLLAAFVLVAIFYLTSFLRGAHEDDG